MSSTPVIPVPSRIDSAEAVRDYIKKVLTESQGMSDESGYHSASEWKSGDGKELREMRVHQFRTTFGNRIGHILYKEVRTQVLEEEDAMSVPWTREARGKIRSSLENISWQD